MNGIANNPAIPIQSAPSRPQMTPYKLDFIPPAPVHFPDPIHQRETGQFQTPVDTILRYNLLDNILQGLKTVFITTPKTVVKGLRGDKDFSFADFMQVSKIPYYAGGLFLMGSFLAGGGNKVPAIRQGLGAAFYYLGVIAANRAIDLVYKMRYGVDLGLQYRRSDGRIEKVFASHDFPRFDLLSSEDYLQYRNQMGIPRGVADFDMAVQDNLRGIISESRTHKLILGNILAAVGAGYLARTDLWARVMGQGKQLWTIWTHPNLGHFGQRLQKTLTSFDAQWGAAITDRIKGQAGESMANKLSRRLAWGVVLGSVALTVLNILRAPVKKQYQETRNLHLPLISLQGEQPYAFQGFMKSLQSRQVAKQGYEPTIHVDELAPPDPMRGGPLR